MIGIIGAMQNEVEQIFEVMTEKEKIQVHDLTFYKGKLYGKDVVVVRSGIGKVNAALSTQLLILTFKVDKVINTGIAGALGKGLKIYDMVVSDKAVYHDFDTRFFGYARGQVPGLPEYFEADPALISAVEKAFAKSDLSKFKKLQKGLVASGDQFIALTRVKEDIVKAFNPLCVEMEGCAIAQTCYVNKVPFVIIRCMSDCADEAAEEDYQEAKAAGISSHFLMEVVQNL